MKKLNIKAVKAAKKSSPWLSQSSVTELLVEPGIKAGLSAYELVEYLKDTCEKNDRGIIMYEGKMVTYKAIYQGYEDAED